MVIKISTTISATMYNFTRRLRRLYWGVSRVFAVRDQVELALEGTMALGKLVPLGEALVQPLQIGPLPERFGFLLDFDPAHPPLLDVERAPDVPQQFAAMDARPTAISQVLGERFDLVEHRRNRPLAVRKHDAFGQRVGHHLEPLGVESLKGGPAIDDPLLGIGSEHDLDLLVIRGGVGVAQQGPQRLEKLVGLDLVQREERDCTVAKEQRAAMVFRPLNRSSVTDPPPRWQSLPTDYTRTELAFKGVFPLPSSARTRGDSGQEGISTAEEV